MGRRFLSQRLTNLQNTLPQRAVQVTEYIFVEIFRYKTASKEIGNEIIVLGHGEPWPY